MSVDLFLIDDSGEDAEYELDGRGNLSAKLPTGPVVTISVGQCVLIRSGGGTEIRPYVAKITRIFARDGKPCFSAQWFYRFEEIRTRILETVVAGVDEVFETDQVESHIADVILGKCQVLRYTDYLAERTEHKSSSVVETGLSLYCRFHYDHHTSEIVPSDIDFVPTEEVPVNFSDDDGVEFSSDGSSGSSSEEEAAVRARWSKRRKRVGSYQFSLPAAPPTAQKLLCREEEKKAIAEFVRTAVDETTRGSRCLYISGVPGTGKTATVMEVLSEMKDASRRGEIGAVKVAEVNGMAVTDAVAAYSVLLGVTTRSQGIAPMHAAAMLDGVFSKGRRGKPLVVLVIDEMDTLVSRKQKVLYDLLEWSTRDHARLAIIGIANTMDLPERVLPRIASRLGLNRLVYAPYTSAQLMTILDSVLPTTFGHEKAHRFNTFAIELCARKVAAVSGDVRRALEICRRALELSQRDGGDKLVSPLHITNAVSDLSGWGVRLAVSNLSTHEKALLSTAAIITRDSTAEISSDALLTRTISQAPSLKSCREQLHLAALRLIASNYLTKLDQCNVALNISIDDALLAQTT